MSNFDHKIFPDPENLVFTLIHKIILKIWITIVITNVNKINAF